MYPRESRLWITLDERMCTRRKTCLQLLAILVAGVMALSGCGAIKRSHDAALLLADVQAGTADSRLKRQTELPARTSLSYSIHGRNQVADRYRSGDSHRGSLVLIHGFTEAGRRDSRLVEFAQSLARSGFDVLVPELPGLTAMAVGTSEVNEIATALRFAVQADGFTGVAAVSFAAGPTLIAAKQPDLADRVAYVVVLGGYYDLVDAIRYATTGVDAGSKPAEPIRQPRHEGKWLLLLGQLDHVADPGDRILLQAIAERRMADAGADIENLREKLGAEGAAVYQLITNRDPERTVALLKRLPDSAQQEIKALDLSRRDLSGLHARLLLIHGREDPVIPLSHSERLVNAVAPGQAQLFIAGGLGHVDVSPGFWGGFQLWRAAFALMKTAEEHPHRPSDNPGTTVRRQEQRENAGAGK
ncbi:MAG: alpha/beta hydrolase [Aquisalimonadaceae bacterium]